MSEIKRVALNTLEPQRVNDKVNKKVCKTIRISVILPESNEDNCPEYNYKDQLAAVKKRQKVVKDPGHVENGLDAFTEDDDDVRRIALEMEAKYGSNVTAAGGNIKRKRKGRKDDYADIGMGYDETDSFIDNTDGYDEIIPQNVTTLHGGFYINCGALEFKTDEEASSQVSSSSSSSSSSDSNSEDERPKNRKKRVLDSSDASESDTAKNDTQKEKKQKLCGKNSIQVAIKKKLFSTNKIQVKKKGVVDPLKKTVKELLREKREDLNMSVPGELKEEEENIEKDSLKENKRPMSISSVTDAIESVVKQVVEENYDSNQNRQSLDVNKPKEAIPVKANAEAPSAIEADSSQEENQNEKRELVKLPENIPKDILEIINRLKQAALDYKGEGKKKFFSDEVNSHLLSLERKCKVLGKSSRVRVYEHLSYYIKVRKETLVRRAKILLCEDEESRLKRLTQKLKDAVGGMMPALIAYFEQESQKVLQKKFSKDNQSEENKALRLPRRRFQWTEETKKLLKDILTAKKKCLLLEGKQKDNLEELMVSYLRTSILPLWPEGWMYLNNLKKVFNSMTEPSTKLNEPVKDPKPPSHDSPTPPAAIPSAPKHSNLSIIPVTTASKAAKTDVSNSVTVTKITTNDVKNGNKPEETASNSKTIEMTMSSSQLLKKMINEIGKSESKSSPSTSSYKDAPKIERDSGLKRTVSLEHAAKPSKPSRPNEVFKPYADKTVLLKDPPKPWSKELFLAPSEQSVPTDYSKHRHADSKTDFPRHSKEEKNSFDHSKLAWPHELLLLSKPRKEEQQPAEVPKHVRHGEMSSSRHHHHHHHHHSEKSKQQHHSRQHNEVPKSPTVLDSYKQISDMLKMPQELTTKHKQSESLKLAADGGGVIVKNAVQKDEAKEERNNFSSAIPKPAHCQLSEIIDMRNKAKLNDMRPLPQSPDLFTGADQARFYPEPLKKMYPDFGTGSGFLQGSAAQSTAISKSEGDDIQMVMENLRALQKLSCSPIKTEGSAGSPVSVIAYNKTYSTSKAAGSGQNHSAQRSDSNNGKGDLASSFQDDFQKQFINSLQQMAANPAATKTNYRCS